MPQFVNAWLRGWSRLLALAAKNTAELRDPGRCLAQHFRVDTPSQTQSCSGQLPVRVMAGDKPYTWKQTLEEVTVVFPIAAAVKAKCVAGSPCLEKWHAGSAGCVGFARQSCTLHEAS